MGIRSVKYSLIVLFFAIAATVAISVIVNNKSVEKANSDFAIDVLDAKDSIRERLNVYIEVVYGGRALFAASDSVTRADWKTYLDSTDILNRYPGIFALQYVRYVEHSDKEEFIRNVREDRSIDPRGYPDFNIHPEGDRDAYVVVDYNEPFEKNKMAFGYDIISEPIRKAAAEYTRDTGSLAFSGKLTLLEQTTGFLINYPVYKNGMPLETVGQRREAFTGFVLGVFSVEELMSGALGGRLEQSVRYSIYDGGPLSELSGTFKPSTESIMYESHPEEVIGYRGNKAVETLDVGLRRWFIYFYPHGEYLTGFSAVKGYLVFAVGMAVSFLLFFLMRSLEEKARVEEAVRESEYRYRELVENANCMILRWDAKGTIRFINEYAQKFFGYSEKEALGRSVPESIVTRRNQSTGKTAGIIEKIAADPENHEYIESESLRHDGQRVWIAWRNRPIYGEDGKLKEMLSIGMDFTDRKRMEEELRRTRDIAVEATKIKDKFVSLVSHDLRGPIGSIASLVEHAGDPENKMDNSSWKRIASGISSVTNGLLVMIDRLLNISRFQTGDIRLAKTFFSAAGLVAHCIASVSHLADKKGVRIKNELPKNIRVFADFDLLGEVLINLIVNAIKFCREGDEITVYMPEGLQTTIAVKDTGVGIDGTMLPDIFKQDVKTTTKGTDGEKGTGLGLPYSREIVEAHGGTLDAESVAGEGSAFYIRMPVEKLCIIVADDDLAQREIIKKRLNKVINAEILEAENGQQVLDLLHDVNPHLIITDLIMPVMDGFELLRRIKSDSLLASIPVIVNTSLPDQSREDGEQIDMRSKAFSLGAADYIVKPIVPEDFIPRVMRFLG